MKWSIGLLSSGLLILLTQSVYTKQIVQGSIQFPSSVCTLPNIRVYYAGNKIGCEADHHTKHLTFSVPIQDVESTLYLLVAQSIQIESEENTVKYLKVDPDYDYLLYRLELIRNHDEYEWAITSEVLSPSGKIPDSTVIVCFNPHYVSCISGGNTVTLPTLVLDNNLLDRLGSESRLHDLSCELLLACLDFDTIHSAINACVKQGDSCRTLVLINS
jgi:hypothetical protein